MKRKPVFHREPSPRFTTGKMKRTIGLAWFAVCLLSASLGAADMPEGVKVDWLGKKPPVLEQGVSWGVPWTPGSVSKDQSFLLKAPDGKTMPLQTWPLAFWPDGSIKWLGCATVAMPGQPGPLNLLPGEQMDPGQEIKILENETEIEINTGKLIFRVPRTGSILISEMLVDGKTVARDGHLKCILEKEEIREGYRIRRLEDFVSDIQKISLEQAGPVRVVVKLEGMHKSVQGQREWLPFVVRFYFYTGQTSVRMIHTIICNGNEHEDFIRGLGLAFTVPMREGELPDSYLQVM